MQSLVKTEKHVVWEGEVTVWQEVSFELFQKSRIPEAPLASFLSFLLSWQCLLTCLAAWELLMGTHCLSISFMVLLLLLVP